MEWIYWCVAGLALQVALADTGDIYDELEDLDHGHFINEFAVEADSAHIHKIAEHHNMRVVREVGSPIQYRTQSV